MDASGRPRPWSIALALAGMLVGLLGLLVACISLALLSDPQVNENESQRLSWMLCFFCLALPSLLTGALTLWSAWWRRGQERERSLQQQVVQMARARADTLTADELALHSPLSQDAAQAYLEKLVQQGICRREQPEADTVRYVFPRDRSEQSGLDRVTDE